jgi:D-arginine dehydrogenase
MHASEAHVIIIGGGIAGASIGYWLAPHARVILIEREAQPGYHSTGRSAAMFIECYGTPQVRALTMASRAFLEEPPPGFTDHPLLSRRGELIVAAAGQQDLLARHEAVVRRVTQRSERLDADGACALVPVLRRDAVVGAIYEPDAADIDVHALHHGYLRGLRRAGGEVVCNAEVTDLRRDGDHWHVMAAGRSHRAPIVVNAAGAWGDVVGRRAGLTPIGLQPKRRTAFVFAPPAGHDIARWPAVIAADESWYVKPDAGQLLGSPANADPVEPHDVQAEELDVARGIHRIAAMTTLAIRRPARVWAGLRSFVRDGDLVGGFDPDGRGFFWLVAQGGYGIQTSAAMGEACAALVLGEPLPQRIADFGLTAAMLSPRRLHQAKA